jgi:hypothetical protein
MKTLLLTLSLLLSIGSVNAADFLGYKHPFYYFNMNNKLFLCQPHKDIAICLHTVNGVTVAYKCQQVKKGKGYLKNCIPRQGMKLEGL